MLVVLQLVTVIIALILTPGLLFHFDVTPKITVLLVGTSVCLLFFRKNYVRVRAFTSTTRGFWFTSALLAHLMWSAIATVWSSSTEWSLYGTLWRRFGLITFAAIVLLTLLSAARMSGNVPGIQNVLASVVLSGAVLSVYGILQYFGVDPILHVKTYSAGEGPFEIVRPPGSFGHADYFATWLVFVAFAALALSRVDGKRWITVVARVTAPLTVAAIVLTGTRAALVGLVAGVIVLIASGALPLKSMAMALIPACLLASAFIVSPAGTQVRARIHWSRDDLHGGARLLIWRDSLKMASKHPVTGSGPETFSLRFPQVESRDLARAYPDFYHESAHNVLMDELTAKGVPGLVLFLATVVAALWPAPRLMRGNWLIKSLTAMLVSLLICEEFSVFVAGTAFAFYLAAALLVAAKMSPNSMYSTQPSHAVWFAVPAFTLSAVFALYAVSLTVGDYLLARANASLVSYDRNSAERNLTRAIFWLPPGPQDDLYFSRAMASLAVRSPDFLAQAAAWRDALSHAVRAVSTAEDRQNAWYSLASMLAQENDTTGVERCLRNAIAWAPNWFKPHWKLAQLLALSGHHREASLEARTAFDLDDGRDPEVTTTFKELSQ